MDALAGTKNEEPAEFFQGRADRIAGWAGWPSARDSGSTRFQQRTYEVIHAPFSERHVFFRLAGGYRVGGIRRSDCHETGSYLPGPFCPAQDSDIDKRRFESEDRLAA